jgi:nicotinamidase-related amidase
MAEATRERFERALGLLTAAAEQLGIATLYTEQYPKGLGPTVSWLLPLLQKAKGRRFEKLCFSADDADGLSVVVSDIAPEFIVVVGMETHVGVFQTVRDLASRGYRVAVPFDGVASRREDHRDVGLELCRGFGAQISSAETLVFDWLRQAGTSDFKSLAPHIR